MQYLLMCCFDEQLWEKMPEAQKGKIMEKNGKRVTTDGPFVETKEQLGGSFRVECKDRDETMAIAGGIPTLRAGGAIAVQSVAWTSPQ